jgi:hypothetical protein
VFEEALESCSKHRVLFGISVFRVYPPFGVSVAQKQAEPLDHVEGAKS